MSSETTIRYIEELSLNAWPSHKIELYDGWLIRFSYNYTHRTNSVEQVGASTLPIEEKIAYCERMYRNYRTPAHFKINPIMDPGFDSLLESKGYEIKHVTEVMTLHMEDFRSTEPLSVEYEFFGRNSGLPNTVHYSDSVIVRLSDTITDDWIQGLFRLNGTSDPVLKRIVPSMYAAIPKETIVAWIEMDGHMVASGLGILDRDYVGVYAIYVDPGYRKRGCARSICCSILEEARKKNASKAYLQVVKGNTAGKHLYRSLGFQDYYTYWFRSKEC